MTDVEQLNERIGEVERHVLTSADGQQAMVDRIKEGLSAIQAGFVRKQVEIEEHKDEITRLRYENGRLRDVVDRLLKSVEQGYGGGMRDVLSDLEARIGGLVELAEAEVSIAEEAVVAADEDDRTAEATAPAEAPDTAPEPTQGPASEGAVPSRDAAPSADEAAPDDAAPSDSAIPSEGAGPSEGARKASVSGGKSAWLAEVMRRAAALSAEVGEPEERAGAASPYALGRNVEAYGPEPRPLSQAEAAGEDGRRAADGRAA